MTARRLSLLCTVLLVSLFLETRASSGQLKELGGGLLVGSLIESAENSVHDVVEHAGDRADETLLRAAYAAELAIAQAKVAYAESLDKTLDALDKAERDTLVRTLELVQSVEAGLGKPIADLKKIEEDFSATARLLPFTKTDPIVIRWGPQYFVARDESSPVRVTVEGKNLAAGKPFAVFRGHRLDPTLAITDDRLIFEIPGKLAQAESFEPITLDLRLSKRETSFIFFENLVARDYRVSVFPVPAIAGVLTIYGKKDVENTVVENRRTSGIKCHAQHCQKDSETTRIPVAEKGVVLKMDSVKWHTTYETRNSSDSIKDISPGGFTVKLKCKSYDYGPGCAWKGTRGQIKGYATYQVVKTTNVVAEQLLAENRELRWESDLRLGTTTDLRTVIAVMTTMLGGTEVLGPGEKGRFFRVSFDRTAGELLIRPNPLAEVLADR